MFYRGDALWVRFQLQGSCFDERGAKQQTAPAYKPTSDIVSGRGNSQGETVLKAIIIEIIAIALFVGGIVAYGLKIAGVW